jgi:signal transduction histidine kinase
MHYAPVEAAESDPATLRWLRATAWAAIVLPLVIFIAACAYLYWAAMRDARFEVERATLVAREHAQKILETNVALISRVLDLVRDQPDDALLARERDIHDTLARMSADVAQLQGIFVLSGRGRLLATDRAFPAPHDIDYTDRELFRHHRDGKAQPLITEVLESRATGEPFFDVSMRRSTGSGVFDGAISTSLRPEYFHRFYRQLANENPNVAVALVRDDGAVLASWPTSPTPGDDPAQSPMRWAVDLASGVSRGPVADGVDAIRAMERVGSYPIRVVSWIPMRAVTAPWHAQVALLGAITLLIAIAVTLVARVAILKAQRSIDAYNRLNEEVGRREHAEIVLRQAQKLEALGRLTGGVAHDFNNLLMVIQTNAHILKRRSEHSLAGSSEIAAIERATTAGSKLTRQLLSFSRSQPFREEVIELTQVLPASVEMLRTAIGSRIEVSCAVEPDTRRIAVDPAEFELALLNLALNARDAMPSHGTLAIHARNASTHEAVDVAGPAVIVDVTDTGQGIGAAILDRVFEPFFTTKPAGHGTGLGLSQVYGFCTRSGGKVKIESRLGVGTTVRMLLPASAAPAATPEPAAPRIATAQGQRVLLVDDNEDVASSIRNLLEDAGYRSTSCFPTS